MAHAAQKSFFNTVKDAHYEKFVCTRVLDCGSLNVNGTIRDLFIDPVEYVGIDIVGGPDVDIVASVAEFKDNHFGHDGTQPFEVIVSGEMLEHDEFWKEDIQRMIDMLKSGGLLAVSCAGKDRPEHGTRRTGSEWGTNPDYYRNIEALDVEPFRDQFEEFYVIENTHDKDLYFYGIKK